MNASTEVEKNFSPTRFSLDGTAQRASTPPRARLEPKPLPEAPGLLGKLLLAAEQRYGEVINIFQRGRDIKDEAAAAETSLRANPSLAALAEAMAKRAEAVSLPTSLDGDESDLAEFERLQFLNQPETFSAILEVLKERLIEVRLLQANRRKRYADALHKFVFEGSDLDDLGRPENRELAVPVIAAQNALIDAQWAMKPIVHQIDLCREAIRTGGLREDGSDVRGAIDNLIALCLQPIPTH